MEDVGETFGKLGWFFATVMLGLGIHGLILLPALYGIMTKSLPFNFTKNMSRALATAFGTSSSSATLPVTIDCLENENKIDSRVRIQFTTSSCAKIKLQKFISGI